MPLVVIIVPVIVGGWPIFSALAAAAAAGLGFKLLKKTEIKREEKVSNEIELTDEKSQVIEESLKPEEELVHTKEGITITFKKDLHEKFTICVRGEKKTNEELIRIGKQFLKKIKQQYAYQKVKEELTRKGFTITQEAMEANRIKIILRKF